MTTQQASVTLPRSLDDGSTPQKVNILRRAGRHPSLMHYHRLIALVALVNLAFLIYGATRGGWWSNSGIDLTAISNLVLLNFTLTILIRQQYIINTFFRIATSAPTTWPLSIRWILGKVYHFGGLHVGGALAGTVWYAIFVGSLALTMANGLPGASVGILAVTSALLLVLLAIGAMALPPMRARFHNSFELSHRFGGWTALLLFWAQTLVFAHDTRGAASFGGALLSAPGFWLLIVLTVSIIIPWLRLRRVPVEIVRPSPHVALTRFDHGVTPFAGSSTSISRSPLREWHAFANIPTPAEEGFRLAISRAGDWTGDFIDDAPSHVWVKGIPTAGVGNIDRLFKRVVWVATGSGIGPVLPHLLAHEVPAHLVWSTRSPRETYGDDFVDEILAAEPQATIWDTSKDGRPDLVELALKAYTDFDAEAVICISNKKLTWQVVYGMEGLGIPAYGAIWDS